MAGEARAINAPPRTEGIKYAGSKKKLIPRILELASSVAPKSVFDAFSGTTRVAQAFAKSGYRVIANDRAVWSLRFGTCYLLDRFGENRYRPMIDHLNSLPGRFGWFAENYGGLPGKNGAEGGSTFLDAVPEKRPWQLPNAMKLDAIREEIGRMDLSFVEESVLLTSLMLALDRVDSTLGHYSSYLREWSPRSFGTLALRLPLLFENEAEHTVLGQDVFDALPRVKADLAYLDPPYGSNNERMPPSRVRYAAYYHLWTSICLNDRPPLFGKARRRSDSSDPDAASVFEDFRKGPSGRYAAVEAIERLIRGTNAGYILLSYGSGGRATAAELAQVLAASGRVLKAEVIDYRRNVMAEMRWTNEWVREAEEPNREFLFLLEKR
jgi:adenine-specific DNA-methyltransferase